MNFLFFTFINWCHKFLNNCSECLWPKSSKPLSQSEQSLPCSHSQTQKLIECSYHFCLSVASTFVVIVEVFWTIFVCWLVVKILNHFRRLINKFIFSKDFLVLSLNVSLSLTTFWGIFVWIILSSLFVEFRKKFIISAL